MHRVMSVSWLLVGGCAFGPGELEHVDLPTQLDALPGLAVQLHSYLGDAYWNPGPIGQVFSASLGYRVSDLLDVDRGTAGCAQLDESFTATLGGIALPIRERGHWSPLEGYRCIEPTLSLGPIPDALRRPGVQLVLADASRTITAELGDLFVQRTAEPVGAPAWQFQPGQQVTMKWSPTSDLSSARPRVRLLGPVHLWHDLNVDVFQLDDVAHGSDTLAFSLPEVIADGPMVIEFDGGGAIDCGGLECRLSATQRVVHDAVIAP